MITIHFERPELPAWAREIALPWMKMCYPGEHNPWPGSHTIGRWPLGNPEMLDEAAVMDLEPGLQYADYLALHGYGKGIK